MIAVRHPIQQKIDDERTFLDLLICLFPTLHNEWKARILRNFRQQASETANGDEEVERTIFRSLSDGLEPHDFVPHTFHAAMLVMVYAYYDTIAHLLCNQGRQKPQLEALCRAKDIELSPDQKADISFLNNVICPIRNHLVHNNSSADSKSERDTLEKICKEYSGLSMDDGVLSLTNSSLATEALGRAHRLLTHIARQLGYVTRYSK